VELAAGEGPSGTVTGRLETTLRDCRQDLEYRVAAGPVESPVYRLAILRPLALKKVEAAVEPPAYTRKPPAAVTEGNFTVLEGSRVRFHFTLDRPAAEAHLSLSPGDVSPKSAREKATTLPLRVEGTELTAELPPAEKDLVYEIRARAADGMELEPARFRMGVRPDRKPSVQFLHPREQLEVTPTTEVRLQVRATDDLGVGKVGIVYQVGSGPKKTLYLNDPAGQPTSHTADAVLPLEEHTLSFQDAISYYAFAEDNKPGSPQRATTELQFIDIRPFKREYQVVKGEGCCCNGNSVTLEELITRQRANLQRTFVQAEQTAADAEVVRKLAGTERELVSVTEEFMQGMEARAGAPIPALHEALEAMTTAAWALEEKRLPAGRDSEESALAGLIKARENLRQILKDSKCASACRKFDSQQKQKLRKPPEKDKDKKEQAKTQEALERLAREEKKLSEEIAAKQGGAKLEKPDSDKPQGSKPQVGKPSPSQGSQESGDSPKEGDKPSEGTPLQRQQRAAQAAAQLQEQFAKDEALKGLPRERMDNAAKAIDKSAQDLEGKRETEAGKQAAQAARELERLARQVEAIKAAELAARLAAAQALAKQVAREQDQLNKEVKGGATPDPENKKPGAAQGQAARQREVAEEARTLADLLKKAQEQAEEKSPQIGKALRQVREAHPPEQAVEHMRRAADALQEGRPQEGGRETEQAARLAEALARAVEEARRGFLQPQLDKLLAAEKKAAEAHKALHSADSEAKKAEAEKKIADLRETLDKLPGQDQKVSEAAAALTEAMQKEAQWGPPGAAKPQGGHYIPPREYEDTVKRVVHVLQAKIQEVILKDALLDKDEPVPPQFKALVEEYYRVLSEDLR
jgi:hypothetical protein